MNDDQLRRHFERRADRPTPDLLPAIQSAISTQPEGLSSTPFPAFAGLVATIAVLLAVMVAFPSIVPGAPSGQPSPTASPAPETGTVVVSDPRLVATGPGWWELAAHERPTAESTELDVVVFERACAGGHSPLGRIEGPQIEYDEGVVSITFSVRSLPGEGDCPLAPGVPWTVQLAEPLGDRRINDGGFNSVDVVIESSEELLAISSSRVDQLAHERFEAMLGGQGCTSTIDPDSYVPTQEELEAAASELGGEDGFVAFGGYLTSNWLRAARAFGAIEAYAGRPKPWYIVRSVDDSLVLETLDPLPISGGRTIWYAGLQTVTSADPGCGAASPTPWPSSDPQTVEERRTTARQVLDDWASFIADAPADMVVLTEGLTTQDHGWSGPNGDNAKSALGSGVIETEVELPADPPPPAEISWSDGSHSTVELLSAADALEAVKGDGEGECGGCTPVHVVEVRLTMHEYDTARGPTELPSWEFTLREGNVHVFRVAVAHALSAHALPERSSAIQSVSMTPGSDELKVRYVGGACTDADRLRAHAVESDLAVVIFVSMSHQNVRTLSRRLGSASSLWGWSTR